MLLAPKKLISVLAPVALSALASACVQLKEGAPSSPAPSASTPTNSTDTDSGTAGLSAEEIVKVRGGACESGAKGQTAFSVRWKNGPGAAVAVVERWGLPQEKPWRMVALDSSASHQPCPFGDTGLTAGGVELTPGSSINIELNTEHVGRIITGTVSLRARSYNTTESGSFSVQTSEGTRATPQGSLANGSIDEPDGYFWTSLDVTDLMVTGEHSFTLKIEPGPPSKSLSIGRVELCLDVDD